MKRLFAKGDVSMWTRELALLGMVVFVLGFGQGVVNGARMNFFIETLGLDGGQVLWLEGIREIPGLALIAIAALVMHLPLTLRGAISILIIGVGYALYALVQSYTGLVAVAVTASFGFHGWMPIQPALGMGMAPRSMSGRVMGSLASVSALATIVGMGAIALISNVMQGWSLRLYYVVGGGIIILAGLLLFRLPRHLGATAAKPPRMLVKRRYWLYYVLTFFEGSRKEVVGTFGTLVLVQTYGLKVWQVSSLLFASAAINFLCAPLLGYLVDRFGERRMMPISYMGLVLGCVAFALVQQVWLLMATFIMIRLLIILGMGLSTYVNRIAPPEELSPTLSAGISINHVSSVAMPLIAGALLPMIGYGGVFLGTAGIIALSIPFALALRIEREPEAQLQTALAE